MPDATDVTGPSTSLADAFCLSFLLSLSLIQLETGIKSSHRLLTDCRLSPQPDSTNSLYYQLGVIQVLLQSMPNIVFLLLYILLEVKSRSWRRREEIRPRFLLSHLQSHTVGNRDPHFPKQHTIWQPSSHQNHVHIHMTHTYTPIPAALNLVILYSQKLPVCISDEYVCDSSYSCVS